MSQTTLSELRQVSPPVAGRSRSFAVEFAQALAPHLFCSTLTKDCKILLCFSVLLPSHIPSLPTQLKTERCSESGA